MTKVKPVQTEMLENEKDLEKSLSVAPSAPSFQLDMAKKIVNHYFLNNVVCDFSTIPEQYKIAMVQRTPKSFVKQRDIGGNTIPYVSHTYAEKALNFISDFQWGSEEIASDVTRFKEPKMFYDKAKRQKVQSTSAHGELLYNEGWEAMVTLKCWLIFKDKKIERVVCGGHKQYDNIAISKADCKKSAISKAYTSFAKTFGIGVDLEEQEKASYEKIQKAYEDTVIDTSDFSS